MQLHQTAHDGCIVLRLVGVLDLAGAHEVRRHLLKVMAEQPVALICDLHDVDSTDSACAAVFPTAWRESGGWPGVSLRLCGPNRAVMSQLRAVGLPRFVAVHPTLGEALAGTHALPPYLSRSTTLRFHPLAAHDGRAFISQTWQDWRLEGCSDDAVLMLSEMVSNSIRYGAPPVRLAVRLHANVLRIAVTDSGAARPRPRLTSVGPDGVVESQQLAEGGRGLQLVAALASAWGISEAHEGQGKTVWSELRVRHP